MESFQSIASSCQSAVLEAIPSKWRLQGRPEGTDVRHIPRSCGLMTPQQLLITEKSATELLSELHSGSLTSVEVTEAFCARAAIAHQCINCLTAYIYEEAIARAAELDEIFAKSGPVGPLHGLPFAVKDYYQMKGHATTLGYVAWHSKIALTDASIVQLFKKCGAIPFARTTMPQTGMMLQTVSNLWGRTLNPYNTGFSAGGSSGGDGSLVGMRGSPFCASTDIGGSIRAPATFNGLYGIRPTAERIPKNGLVTTAPGQVSIKVSSGPVCHSVADIKLVTKLLLSHFEYIGYESTAVPMPWREVKVKEKLRFGLLKYDGVVKPQPPILRALDETAASLKRAGHEDLFSPTTAVVEFELPFDAWDVALTTWRLYFQTGAAEVKAVAASTGEPLMSNFSWYLDTFDIKPLTVPELFQLNAKQAENKRQFFEAWKAANIDALICPCAPSAGFPHDFPVWWGYFSLWNVLDYPSTILPLKGFKIDPVIDAKDFKYVPKENVFDKMNWEVYDPVLWGNQPVCIQIVRPPYTDEELIDVTERVDEICNS
ncbi:putative Amidase [Venustampulla echinocandica]|uniref:Putative Amidase n=1 Tax=Venustampulla echinocandica TaxID=2656787 RepID=A0A370T942_9HELO|nr:putative Amidase [Venustampulla echinocandica]RDL30015.1 putative Amidase [Venustampulla echinocandica]